MNRNSQQSTRAWRVASGHAATTRAAVTVLEAGGTAADAAVAAGLAATVAEPMLCSLGGGLHALVAQRGRAPLALDGFAHTPRQRRVDDLDFYPITGNFGTDVQEFHVGMAAIATPGMLAALISLHRRYGRMPLQQLVEPAQALAADGVGLNDVQHYTLRILEPIVRATEASARLFGLAAIDAPLPDVGSVVRNSDLAGFLEPLGHEGPDLFYRGEAARRLAADSAERGGHLGLADLAGYRPRWRRPLTWRYRHARLWSTPPPAFGGMMLALATHGLEQHLPPHCTFGDDAHLDALVRAMRDSEDLRHQLERPDLLHSGRALRTAFRGLIDAGPWVARGTTHLSIDDGRGLAVAMTLSNGEGCGYVLPDSGIMLNNMLGEEDINRTGFHTWPLNRRLASMMAPTILQCGRRRFLLGSGGSNRIRTTLAQVICALVDFDMPLEAAIAAPRLHFERDGAAMETPPQTPPERIGWLLSRFPEARRWPQRNLYFGGVHAVGPDGAVADIRRGGCATSAELCAEW